jgi:hypothetical protein
MLENPRQHMCDGCACSIFLCTGSTGFHRNGVVQHVKKQGELEQGIAFPALYKQRVNYGQDSKHVL